MGKQCGTVSEFSTCNFSTKDDPNGWLITNTPPVLRQVDAAVTAESNHNCVCGHQDGGFPLVRYDDGDDDDNDDEKRNQTD